MVVCGVEMGVEAGDKSRDAAKLFRTQLHLKGAKIRCVVIKSCDAGRFAPRTDDIYIQYYIIMELYIESDERGVGR